MERKQFRGKLNHLLSALILALSSHGWAWSIGIGGVISVGDDGVKVGSDSKGTNIPTPNCGGTICDTLEKNKRDLTGESKRIEAEKEMNAAKNEMEAAQAELNNANATLQNLEKELSTANQNFTSFKNKTTENSRALFSKFDNYLNIQFLLGPLLVKAGEEIKSLERNLIVLQKESLAAASAIKVIDLNGLQNEPIFLLEEAIKASSYKEAQLVSKSLHTYGIARQKIVFASNNLQKVFSKTSNMNPTWKPYLQYLQLKIQDQIKNLSNLEKKAKNTQKSIADLGTAIMNEK